MSVDLEPSAGLESTHDALSECRTAQDEFGNFFGDVFDQLQSLSLELFARHKCLEFGVEQRAEGETVATDFQGPFQQMLEALGQIHNEICNLREDMQRQRTELLELCQGQQQAAWQEQRAGLQAELESARQEAAQQSQALAEHKEMAAEHQAELTGEVKRMRSMLEALSGHIRVPAANNGSWDGKTIPLPDTSVIGSVLAQFETLRDDISQRRRNTRSEQS